MDRGSRSGAVQIKLDLDEGDEVTQLFSRASGLFVVTKNKILRVRSPNDLDPSALVPNVPWEQSEYLPFGTKDPFVARTVLQTDRLAGIFFPNGSSKYVSMMDISWEVLNSVVSLRVIKERLHLGVEEIKESIGKDINAYQNDSVSKRLPSLNFYDIEFRSFVNEVRRSLSNISQLFEILTPHKVRNGHFHKAMDWASQEVGKDSILYQMLQNDMRWIKLWIDMRIAIEHPTKDNYIETLNFALEADRTIRLPTWRFVNANYDMGRPQNLLEAFSTCIENVLKFFEDLQVVLIDGNAPTRVGVAFQTLDEGDRDPNCPMRLRFEQFVRASR